MNHTSTREISASQTTPPKKTNDGKNSVTASDNPLYRNFPAIVFGFPLMFLATLSPEKPLLTPIILALLFAVMNVILFRSFIFKKRKKRKKNSA